MYKWDAEDYKNSSLAQLEWAIEVISKLELKGNEKILDIGCGDGKITAQIARKVPEGSVLGIDSSKEMISLARKTFNSKKYSNLNFILNDAQELDFNNEFDIVFSNAALHWIKDHLSLLEQIKHSLRPSGKILFQMGGKGNAESILKIADEMINDGKWEKYFEYFEFPYGFYSAEEYKEWLQKVGFNKIRVQLISKDMEKNDESEMAGWIRTTWLPYTQRVPEELQKEFIEELIKRYLEKYPKDGKEHIHVGMVRLEVEATK
ncbi:class I SAM-dependent methyltransferase [Methanobacterium oryzae]|uniref:class I SAM-dependent methyltransferase n=1 Tax=Methanobacterium oryzae TaxID=69540 RepID=UPI003D20B88F